MTLQRGFAICPVLLVLILAAGCASFQQQRYPYSLDELYASTVEGRPQLRYFPGQDPDLSLALEWEDPAGTITVRGDRFDILALSSGGPDGAYGAGALKGMAHAGTRAQYEVVTGVSTGALIAPFAFVGAEMDETLEALYTSGELARALGRPNVLAAATGPALYPGNRIPQFMNRYIDGELLARIAAEHEAGRRLLVATANLDADQLTIWNMGYIARLGGERGLALFQSVLRAAIAIPGAISPVEIISSANGRDIRELHGDAGVLAYFYAEPDLVPSRYLKMRGNAGPRIDIILHNQIEAPTRPVAARTLPLAGKSVSNLARTAMNLLLDRTIEDAAGAGLELRYAFIPDNWTTVTSLDFDRKYMVDTFDLGFRNAVSGELWHSRLRERGEPD